MVGNHRRSLSENASPSLKVASPRQSSWEPQVNIHHITDRHKYSLPVCFLGLFSRRSVSLQSASCSLMMFVCPWQTRVLRNASHWAQIGFWCSINHKQRKKPKTFTLRVREGRRRGGRHRDDIMRHSVWMWLFKKTAMAEWTHQGDGGFISWNCLSCFHFEAARPVSVLVVGGQRTKSTNDCR